MKKAGNIMIILPFLIFLVGVSVADALLLTIKKSPLSTANVTVGVSVDYANEIITITEDWQSGGELFIEFWSDTAELLNSWQIVKEKTNNTGIDWTSFEEELMQPRFDANNNVVGWVGSNDRDQLDFAQGEGLPRTSNQFASIIEDELADRDFLQFFDGLVGGAGGLDSQSFYVDMPFQGDIDGAGPPFALRERPNVSVPDASVMLLLGPALIGLYGLGRRKFRS